jgi:hypothetical protein
MRSALVFVMVVTLTVPALAHVQPTPLRDAASREVMKLARTAGAAPPQAAQVRQRSWVARLVPVTRFRATHECSGDSPSGSSGLASGLAPGP